MTIFIILYLILYVATYYYCRWTFMLAFGKDEWDWDGVLVYLFASTITVVTIIAQTLVYREEISDFFDLKIKIKKPNWL